MSPMISLVNSLGARWAAWIVAGSVDAAILLALVALTWRALRARVAPGVGYGLFLLVPLKLIAPATIPLPASWFPSTFAATRPGPSRTDLPREVAIRARQAAVAEIGPLPIAAAAPILAAREVPAARPTEAEPAPMPRISTTGLAMLAWLAAVAALLVRSVWAHQIFRRRLARMPAAEERRLGVDLGGLARLAGVGPTIRVVEDGSIASPAVWGVFRPTVVIPSGIESSLTTGQLRWVLLHELAHVRRRDLAVAAFQRAVTILHFFNPAAWLANRMIDRLREYACDDRATALNQSSAIESGEAFVGVLRQVRRPMRRPQGALGLFGLDTRASRLLRVRRLLDADRPTRTPGRAWAVVALLLPACFAVPSVRATGEPAPSPRQDPAPAASKPAEGGKGFELRVVGPEGRPIPGAVVQIRSDAGPAPEQIRRGQFVARLPHEVTAKADDEGCFSFGLPDAAPQSFGLFITIPRYGPYWADWSSRTHREAIPARFTAELEAGWSVGGILVDDAGKPIGGVRVWPSIEFKKRPGDSSQLGIGTVLTTDFDGRWRFESVPASLGSVTVSIDHPEFRPTQRPLSRAEFGIEPGRVPSAKIAISRGLTVDGKVTDEAGRPIAGALIRTKFSNEVREARSGEDGSYRLVGCSPMAARVVVSAKGRATDVKEVDIGPGMKPVDFAMKPGASIRVRVLDARGVPAPKARIFFQRWRGRFSYFEFDHVSQYADDNGVWAWDEAPLDEFQADICPPGGNGMQMPNQPLIARAEEYVFRLADTLFVSGRVVDAITKGPIKAFRVIPGTRFENNNNSEHWNRRDAFQAADGFYQVRENRVDGPFLLRVEAPGYQAAVSRDIRGTEGSVAVDFELIRGKDVLGQVVTVDGKPARGAVVALGIAGSQIMLKNGDFESHSTQCDRATADQEGRFHFGAQDADFTLIIVHPTGFAKFRGSPDWDGLKVIPLTPWARVEGTFRVGRAPAAGASLGIFVFGLDMHEQGGPNLFTRHETTTGPDGRYTFDRVVPGTGRIGREFTMMVDQGASEVTSSCKVAAEFPAGKTTHLDLGGTGRAVVGKLLPPEGSDEEIRWTFAIINAMPVADRAPRAGLSGVMPEGNLAAAKIGVHLSATVARDGSFRIDDVPEGRYELSAWFTGKGSRSLSRHPFDVPASAGAPDEKPVDLGSLRLDLPAR